MAQSIYGIGYVLNNPEFESRQGEEISLLHNFNQLPMQWVLEVLSAVVHRLGCEADHSSPSDVEVKNEWNTFTSPNVFMA